MIAPSAVVRMIDQIYTSPPINLFSDSLGSISAIIALADEIPAELLSVDSSLFCEIVAAKAQLKSYIRIWETQGNVPRQPPNALIKLKSALGQCHDEIPPKVNNELAFIDDDPEFKKNLMGDIAIVRRALLQGEWKTATVIAGSVIEALLLWKITKSNPENVKTITQARKIIKEMNRLDLGDLIPVAADLKCIKKETAQAADLCRQFRDLIHPGRTIRLQIECDEATALSAGGAMAHVIRDFSLSDMGGQVA